MAIKHAMWVHGHSLTIEDPSNVVSVDRKGNGAHVKIKAFSGTWLHLAIPTPVLVDGTRLKVGVVSLRFKTPGAAVKVTNVHVWDGDTKIAGWDSLTLSGDQPLKQFTVSGNPQVQWGLGISVRVEVGDVSGGGTIQFTGAGCDFV